MRLVFFVKMVVLLRITIDLDNKKDLKKCVDKIITVFKYNPIDEIYLSASKKGYHIIIRGLKLTWRESWLLRDLFMDDKKRIHIDHIRNSLNQVTQVLWTLKGTKKAKKVYDKKRKFNILPIYYKRLFKQSRW